jgi:tetratricopeptide (TPR) repeat protein
MSPQASGPFCPECRKPATGNFCQSCGAKLGGRFCSQCGGKLSPSASFCSQCGAKNEVAATSHRAAAAAVVGGQNLPWWIAGAAMFALIVAIGVSMVRPGPPAAPGAVAPVGAAAVDLNSMSPREAADRLFNRVMTSVAEGDSAGAQAFVPMAIGAYERAQPLDADGLFHLSLLQRTSLDLAGALETARTILEADPDHVLGLTAAAAAAEELGMAEEAAGYYRHLLDVYEAETARGLQEYLDHQTIMNTVRDTAEAFLARP